jgi:hypothetical protein
MVKPDRTMVKRSTGELLPAASNEGRRDSTAADGTGEGKHAPDPSHVSSWSVSDVRACVLSVSHDASRRGTVSMGVALLSCNDAQHPVAVRACGCDEVLLSLH